jgi:hypothetical protein
VKNKWLRVFTGRTDVVIQLFNNTVASNRSNSRSDCGCSTEKYREAAQVSSHIVMLSYSSESIYSILTYLFLLQNFYKCLGLLGYILCKKDPVLCAMYWRHIANKCASIKKIPPGAWLFVCCECCVLSGGGLCDGLITRPERSYRLWRVVLCDQETSKTRRLKPATGLWKIQPQWVVTSRKQTNKQHKSNIYWTDESSGAMCQVRWWLFIEVSEELAASIFRFVQE